ncbi:hypothetical protein MXB_3238 [Myxobolus squamalis]|nr:hypothetical protein MXB_3238 [Myxobolus squamalis]
METNHTKKTPHLLLLGTPNYKGITSGFKFIIYSGLHIKMIKKYST